MRRNNLTVTLSCGAMLLLCQSLVACKDKGETSDTDVVVVDDADSDTDTDSDSDTDTDSDTDSDTDTDVPPAECWVADPSGIGSCFDQTVAGCALPTTPTDSDGDGEPDSFVFLNQCPDPSIQSVPFDNAARIPASVWVPGTPLPPAP